MIYFICSKPHQQPVIEEMIQSITINSTITFDDEFSGTIYSSTEDIQSLELLCQHLQTEGTFTLTMLHSINYPKLSHAVLHFQNQQYPGSFHHILELFIIAMNQQNKPILNEFVNFYINLPKDHLELVKEYSKTDNIILTANNLYVHRNTVTNRLHQFEKLTQLDLKDNNLRMLLRLIDIYINNVHNAQDTYYK